MSILESAVELIKLISLMVFVSSIGAQVWIGILDITKYFTDILEKFRPEPLHDKFTRIAIIIGLVIIFVQ